MADGKIEFEVRADSSKLEADLSTAQKTVDRAAQKTEKAVEEIGQAAEKIGKTVSESNKKAADAIKDVGKEADTTKSKIDGLGSEASESAKKNEALKEELSKVKQELGNVKGELDEVKRKTQETDNATGNLTDSMGKLKSSVADAGKTVATIAGTAGAALAAMGTAAVKSAAEAETSFAKVKTLLATGTDTGAYYDELKAASKRSGVDIGSLSESVYGAISASVAQEDAIAFTEDAVKLAKGGFTETATAVDVLTTAINAYGMSAEDAAHISDVLITTQNLGKTTVDELARSMGQTIPIANSSGAAIEDLSAQYAILTKNGVATAEAGTGIKAMLSELNSSSSNISKTLKELTGSSFSELQASGKNTAEILQILNEHAGSAGQKLSDLFGSVEAGSAALTLVKDGGADFNNVLAQMENSAGATEKAYDIMANTIEERFNRVKNKLSIAFTEVGEELMPEIEKIVDYIDENSDEIADTIKDIGKAAGEAVEFLAGLAKALWDNKEAVAAAVVGLAAFKVAMSIGNIISATAGAIKTFKTATDSATASQLALNAAGAANPFVLIASLATGAVTAIGTFIFSMESATEATKKLHNEAMELNHAAQESKNAAEDLEELTEEYKNLKSASDDVEAVKEQLERIQQDLIDSYGREASEIDLVNGKYEEQLGLLNALKGKKDELSQSMAKAAYLNATEAQNNEYTFAVTAKSADIRNAVQDIIQEEASKFGVSTSTGSLWNADNLTFAKGTSYRQRADILKTVIDRIDRDYGDKVDPTVYNTLVSQWNEMEKADKEYSEIENTYNEIMNPSLEPDDSPKPDTNNDKPQNPQAPSGGTTPPPATGQSDYDTERKSLDYLHDMGEIGDSEYYSGLENLRDTYLTPDSDEWRRVNVEIYKGRNKKSSGGKTTTASSTALPKAYTKGKRNLAHQLAMDEITESEYYSGMYKLMSENGIATDSDEYLAIQEAEYRSKKSQEKATSSSKGKSNGTVISIDSYIPTLWDNVEEQNAKLVAGVGIGLAGNSNTAKQIRGITDNFGNVSADISSASSSSVSKTESTLSDVVSAIKALEKSDENRHISLYVDLKARDLAIGRVAVQDINDITRMNGKSPLI